MESFRKLGISEEVLKAVKEHGFQEPSEIQEKTIPLVVQGKDVIGGSATGSGKTLAFGAGIIQNSRHGEGIQALILTPTRELAEQIRKALHQFSRYHPLKIISVFGGVSINPQIDELRKADIVVGTPGRILDHLSRNTLDLKHVKILVLDEADRMLDMGFIDDVEKIISQCPKKRQTLLFSATISREISRLAGRYMHSPVEISAEQYVDPSKLAQFYYGVSDDIKFSLIVHLLKHEKSGLVMVFCNTRRGVDYVERNLKNAGINAQAIHGGLSQNKRTQTMESFHSGKVLVLVCTDVAARGLDIKNVSHVYNYDIPKTSKEYIHRIGRTARAGKEGKAVSILTERDYDNMRAVLSDSSISIKPEPMPKDIERITLQRGHYGGRPGREGYGREHRGGYGREHGRGYQSRGRHGDGGSRYPRSREGSYGRRLHGGGRSYGAHSEGQQSDQPRYIKNPDGTYSKATGHYGRGREHKDHGDRGHSGERRRYGYRTSNNRPQSGFRRRY